jgi:hypothetical protein
VSHNEGELASDVPLSFACSRPAAGEVYVWADLRPPTTAVARVVDPVGATRPDFLISHIDSLLRHVPWAASSLQSDALFLAADDKMPESAYVMAHTLPGRGIWCFTAPVAKASVEKRLGAPLQFVSLHGQSGQAAHSVPGSCPVELVAGPTRDPAQTVLPKRLDGAAAVVLSCAGASQFPQAAEGGPLLEGYLGRGAVSYTGALSITYTNPGRPELLASGFALHLLRALLRRETFGRAFVHAQRALWRQKWQGGCYVQAMQKTLVQFSLLGDPCLRLLEPSFGLPPLPPLRPRPFVKDRPVLSVHTDTECTKRLAVGKALAAHARARARDDFDARVGPWHTSVVKGAPGWIALAAPAWPAGERPPGGATALAPMVVHAWVRGGEVVEMEVLRRG